MNEILVSDAIGERAQLLSEPAEQAIECGLTAFRAADEAVDVQPREMPLKELECPLVGP